MKFGYTIIYVKSVENTLNFYRDAFGFDIRFIHESGSYGELETGATALAFASEEMGHSHLPEGFVPCEVSDKPLGFEVAFVADDVESAHGVALSAGATEISAPKKMPWGQVVSYVRCPSGILVELCTPVPG